MEHNLIMIHQIGEIKGGKRHSQGLCIYKYKYKYNKSLRVIIAYKLQWSNNSPQISLCNVQEQCARMLCKGV